MAHGRTGPSVLTCALLLACFLVGDVGTAAPARAEVVGSVTLVPEPSGVVSGGTVTVTGSCTGEQDPVENTGGPIWPEVTPIFLDGQEVTEASMTEGVFDPPVEIAVLAAAGVEGYDLTSGCGGEARITILPAPSLSALPREVAPGATVTVDGTCSLPAEQDVVLTLTDAEGTAHSLGSGVVNARTGVLSTVESTVPEGVAGGRARVTSSCEGEDFLTLVVGTDPTETSETPTETSDPAQLVTVPNLLDQDVEGARTELGSDLRLAVSGSGDRIVEQSPSPFERVPVGTTVTVVLGAAAAETSSGGVVLPAWSLMLAAALAAAAVGTSLVARAVRRVRERRWVRRAGFRARAGSWRLPEPPEESVPAVGVRFRTDLTPDRLHLEEVSGART
jgi:hypothetical protein